MNTLFRFGGDMNVALDYFLDLPPNGYNVIQLTDTYASLLASAPPVADRLVPISLSQITLSQLYIRRDDPNFSDLGSFLRYANEPRQDGRDDPVKIALFGTPGDQFGLEDILLKKFAGLYAEQGAEPQVVALPDGAVTDPAADPVQQTDSSRSDIQPARFESGSERYFSLFGASLGSDRQVDALIEQPGDVARLLDGGLLKPIFTFLPERDLDTGAAAELRERLGATPSFPQQDSEECAVYYRFRGFFIPTDVPPDRRAFLEWVFRKAFDSESFHEFNRREYMDVLYLDDSITDSYCSTPHLAQFFQQSVQEYRECLSELNLAGTGP